MMITSVFDFIAARSYANTAIDRKEIKDAVTYKILVTPEASDELNAYLDAIKFDTVTDDHARIYCSNSRYVVRCLAVDPVTNTWLHHNYKAKVKKHSFL